MHGPAALLPALAERGRRVVPYAGRVLWRLGVVLAGLFAVYVLIANLILKTSLLKDFAHTSDELRVDYDSAYSVFPGRIVVRNLTVRFEDYNVEFEIAVERGTLDVSLHELFQKRFHALRVDAKNVAYRMRHKLSRVGSEGPRIAAYPRIPGFPDPPLFRGKRPPPIPDEQYDLWEVVVEGVNADVKEIWILEYRYRGPGVARGSFRVRPARTYAVEGATLELLGGRLTLGEAVVAQRARVKLDAKVTHSETQRLSGLAPFRHISGSVHGTFEGTDLSFLDAYLAPRAGLSARGPARVQLGVRLEHGAVAKGSRLLVESSDAVVSASGFAVRGKAGVELGGPPNVGGPLELVFLAGPLRIQGSKEDRQAPILERVDLRARTTSDFSKAVDLISINLAQARLTAPDLGWMSRTFDEKGSMPRFEGRGLVTLRAQREGTAPFRGAATLVFEDATLRVDDRVTLPWNATVRTEELTAELDGTRRLKGMALLHLDQLPAMLPLVSPSAFLRDIGTRLLDLGALDARVAFRLDRYARLDVTQARSGALTARGHLFGVEGGVAGKFLLSAPTANLGVRVAPGGTSIKPLVGDDWLEEKGIR